MVNSDNKTTLIFICMIYHTAKLEIFSEMHKLKEDFEAVYAEDTAIAYLPAFVCLMAQKNFISVASHILKNSLSFL